MAMEEEESRKGTSMSIKYKVGTLKNTQHISLSVIKYSD